MPASCTTRATRRPRTGLLRAASPERSDGRDVRRGLLRILPGAVRWQIASPLDEFLRAFASGLLQGGELRVGAACFSVASVETLPAPEISEATRFRCLSPVVASVRNGERGAPKYLPAPRHRQVLACSSSPLQKTPRSLKYLLRPPDVSQTPGYSWPTLPITDWPASTDRVFRG